MKTGNNREKKSFLRQLASGAIYTALAAVVVAVTVNTTAGLLDKGYSPVTDNISENFNSALPSVPEMPHLDLSLPDISESAKLPETKAEQVSDTAEGVSDLVTEGISDSASPTESPLPVFDIPEEANLGIERFIKPCDGYVLKEHSADTPVYCATMADYRVHIGVDITGDVGTPVSAVCGGIITDIFDDDLYGKTVCVKAKNGYMIRYSNLFPELNAPINEGTLISTGDIIGSIGQTALAEAVDASHLHLEIYDEEGNALNPEDFIFF